MEELKIEQYDMGEYEFYYFYEFERLDVYALKENSNYISYFNIKAPESSWIKLVRGIITYNLNKDFNKAHEILWHITEKLKKENAFPNVKHPINVLTKPANRHDLNYIRGSDKETECATLTLLLDEYIILKVICENYDYYINIAGDIEPNHPHYKYYEMSAFYNKAQEQNVPMFLEKIREKMIRVGEISEKHNFIVRGTGKDLIKDWRNWK